MVRGNIYSLTRYEDNSLFRHPTKINTAVLQGKDLSNVFPLSKTSCVGVLSSEELVSNCPTTGRVVGK